MCLNVFYIMSLSSQFRFICKKLTCDCRGSCEKCVMVVKQLTEKDRPKAFFNAINKFILSDSKDDKLVNELIREMGRELKGQIRE